MGMKTLLQGLNLCRVQVIGCVCVIAERPTNVSTPGTGLEPNRLTFRQVSVRTETFLSSCTTPNSFEIRSFPFFRDRIACNRQMLTVVSLELMGNRSTSTATTD